MKKISNFIVSNSIFELLLVLYVQLFSFLLHPSTLQQQTLAWKIAAWLHWALKRKKDTFNTSKMWSMYLCWIQPFWRQVTWKFGHWLHWLSAQPLKFCFDYIGQFDSTGIGRENVKVPISFSHPKMDFPLQFHNFDPYWGEGSVGKSSFFFKIFIFLKF